MKWGLGAWGLFVLFAAMIVPSGTAKARAYPTVYQLELEDVCAGGKLFPPIGGQGGVRVIVSGGTCEPPFWVIAPAYVGQIISIRFVQDPVVPGEDFLGVSNVGLNSGGQLFPNPCCPGICCGAGWTIVDDHGRIGSSTRTVPYVTGGLTFDGIHRVTFDGFPGWVGMGMVFFQLTAPCDAENEEDTDGDGLPDSWEGCGLNLAADGTTIESCLKPPCDLNLADMGADPMRKDVFVEIDWMRRGPYARGHWPRRVALERIRAAFDAAPVWNPDGSTGISIHLDAGPHSIMDPATGRQWNELSRSNSLPYIYRLGNCGTSINATCEPSIWADFDAIKAANFERLREPVFRYAVIGHTLDDRLTSGLARGFGTSDVIVSLGDWHISGGGTPKEQGGTLMHELGHAFALFHGGSDHVNYKPNYLSVMNYSFSTRGLIWNAKEEGLLDYSRFALPNLDEGALHESDGLTGGGTIPDLPGYGTRWYCLFLDSGGAGLTIVPQDTVDATGWIDWDCNGIVTSPGLIEDINTGPDTGVENSQLEVLALGGHVDWDILWYNPGPLGKLSMTLAAGSSAPWSRAGLTDIGHAAAAALAKPFEVSVLAPESSLVAPGTQHVLEFEVENTGTSDDVYTLLASVTGQNVQLGSSPTVLALAAGTSSIVAVPIDVASEIAPGTQAVIRLDATSSNDSDVFEHDSVLVPEPTSTQLTAAMLLCLAALATWQRRRKCPLGMRN